MMKKLILLFGTTLLAATCAIASAEWLNLADPVSGVTVTYKKGTFIFEKDRVLLPVRFTVLANGGILRRFFYVTLAHCRAGEGGLVMTDTENNIQNMVPFKFGDAESSFDPWVKGIAGYLCTVAEYKHPDYKGEEK